MSKKKIALALGSYLSLKAPMGIVVFGSIPAFGENFQEAIVNLIGLSKEISAFRLAKLDPAYRPLFRKEDLAVSLKDYISRENLTPQVIEPVPGVHYIGDYVKFPLRDYARDVRPLLHLPVDEESMNEIPLYQDMVMTPAGSEDLSPEDRVFDDQGRQTFGPPLPVFEP